MKKSREASLIRGLQRTQAEFVFVPYEVVCSLISKEYTDELVLEKADLAQKATTIKPLKSAIEEIAPSTPVEAIAKFNRAELWDCIEELAEEEGGLDKLIKVVEDKRSTLQKVRDKITPSPLPQKASAPVREEPK